MVSIPNPLLQELLLSYFRQSLMYSSEMAKNAVYIIRDYFHYMDHNGQRVLVFELEAALDRAKRYGQTLGAQEDHDLWTQLLALCKSKMPS